MINNPEAIIKMSEDKLEKMRKPKKIDKDSLLEKLVIKKIIKRVKKIKQEEYIVKCMPESDGKELLDLQRGNLYVVGLFIEDKVHIFKVWLFFLFLNMVCALLSSVINY